MIQNSMAIKENEFMSKEKLQLLKAVAVLSKFKNDRRWKTVNVLSALKKV